MIDNKDKKKKPIYKKSNNLGYEKVTLSNYITDIINKKNSHVDYTDLKGMKKDLNYGITGQQNMVTPNTLALELAMKQLYPEWRMNYYFTNPFVTKNPELSGPNAWAGGFYNQENKEIDLPSIIKPEDVRFNTSTIGHEYSHRFQDAWLESIPGMVDWDKNLYVGDLGYQGPGDYISHWMEQAAFNLPTNIGISSQAQAANKGSGMLWKNYKSPMFDDIISKLELEKSNLSNNIEQLPIETNIEKPKKKNTKVIKPFTENDSKKLAIDKINIGLDIAKKRRLLDSTNYANTGETLWQTKADSVKRYRKNNPSNTYFLNTGTDLDYGKTYTNMVRTWASEQIAKDLEAKKQQISAKKTK